jgi:hypothetical protein
MTHIVTLRLVETPAGISGFTLELPAQLNPLTEAETRMALIDGFSVSLGDLPHCFASEWNPETSGVIACTHATPIPNEIMTPMRYRAKIRAEVSKLAERICSGECEFVE